MKKLLGIMVLGLLWCNVGFAKIFNVSCEGMHKIINNYNVVTESLFVEDLEITAFPPNVGKDIGKIGRVNIIYSSDINGRYKDYFLNVV